QHVCLHFCHFPGTNMGKSGGATRPVVTLTSNCGNILAGDPMILKCNVSSTTPGTHWNYSWYKDKTLIEGGQQTLQITSSSVKDSGDYQCQIISSDISDPITIYVLEGFEILQEPTSIFEGDLLTIRCHHSYGFILLNTTFYKDDTEIQSFCSDSKTEKTEYSKLHSPEVDMKSVGGYNCNEVVIHGKDHSMFNLSDALKVIVKELFYPPEIKASYWVIQGDNMTVTCETRLDPLRGGTELHFAFYRDGRTVQDFSVSDTYRVRSAQLEDSGNYTCEVRTASDTVRKRSNGFHIQIIKVLMHRCRIGDTRIAMHRCND
ncbi:hypothetical protein AB205_0153350, partial [Aquarana catesbeiana]